MWISERKGDTSTGCGIYPHVLTLLNSHQASYLVSICLIFVFVLVSSVPCGEVRLTNNTNNNTNKELMGCNTEAIRVKVNP